MSCDFYKWNGSSWTGDYWCKKENKRVNSDTYRKYCRDYNYNECPIYGKSSSGCFITTICCNILNMKDNDKFLNDFRSFRDNILQKNSKYYDTLKIYDTVGPIVADKINNDKDKEILAQGLYENALKPIHEHILSKDYDIAVEKYYIMTLMLINYYGYKNTYNYLSTTGFGFNKEEFDPKKSGHGKCKKRVISTNKI